MQAKSTSKKFETAELMQYADDKSIKGKYEYLANKLLKYFSSLKKNPELFILKGETAYIPDVHGDFNHLIQTLFRHGLLEDEGLNLKDHMHYVFLGDFYDRAPDSDVIDYWLNLQIIKKKKVFRLIGNHEMAFFVRDGNGYPVIFPSQDSIKDVSNNFKITHDLLKNIASGNLLAAYVEKNRAKSSEVRAQNVLYVHSYIINDDFKELGLEPNSDITEFAHVLNERLKKCGKEAYELFLEYKARGFFDWEQIMKPFNDDILFNIYQTKGDISASFIWRRTGSPILRTFPAELDVDIPDDVYQIVGHTPVFYFDLPRNQPVNKPFVLQAKIGTGKVQFSDVGIGYAYRDDLLERPEVIINRKFAIF